MTSLAEEYRAGTHDRFRWGCLDNGVAGYVAYGHGPGCSNRCLSRRLLYEMLYLREVHGEEALRVVLECREVTVPGKRGAVLDLPEGRTLFLDGDRIVVA